MSPLQQQIESLDWKSIFRRELNSTDLYTMVVLALYSVLAVIFYQHIPIAGTILLVNSLILLVITLTIVLTTLTDYRIFRMMRHFYVIPVVYLMYDQTHSFVRLIHPTDYDTLLIQADRWMFSIDPTMWFTRHATPILTEYLQICYFLFYVLPVTHAIELWVRGDIDNLARFARLMSFVYYVSYLAYFALPAVGPRFTLHDFALTSQELPGFWLTEPLRAFVNAGGGITPNALDPVQVVNRDCMPSGHTMLTLVNIILAFRFKSGYRWIFAVIGGSLIISTVYLRYHYAVDVLVGIILVAILMPIEPLVDNYCRNYLKKR